MSFILFTTFFFNDFPPHFGWDPTQEDPDLPYATAFVVKLQYVLKCFKSDSFPFLNDFLLN